MADGSYLGFTVQNLNGASGRPTTIFAPNRNAVVTPTADRPDNRDNMNADFSQGGDGVISGATVESNVIYNNRRLGGSAMNMDGVQV